MRYSITITKMKQGKPDSHEERYLSKAEALQRYFLLEANMNTMLEKIIKLEIVGPDFYQQKHNSYFF